jgi:hypothetical protein
MKPERTNRELLDLESADLLHPIDKQRRFVLRMEARPMPCPNCGHGLRRWEALGLDVDAYDLNAHHPDEGTCPNCKRGLRFTLPWPTGDWHWTLIPERRPGR